MARVFSKSDLLYKDYKKSAKADHDNPKIRDGKDHTHLNTTEDYEMAYFIEAYIQSKNWKYVSTGQKIEKFIRNSKVKDKSHDEWRKDLDANFDPQKYTL